MSVDPQNYLADVIGRIANGHPNSRIDELLPRAYAPPAQLKAVALKTPLTDQHTRLTVKTAA